MSGEAFKDVMGTAPTPPEGDDIGALDQVCKLAKDLGSQILTKFGDHLPRRDRIKAVTTFRRALIPAKRPGRRPEETITAAYADWKTGMQGVQLYRKHIPGWTKHSEWRRSMEGRRLNNAMHSRAKRERRRFNLAATEGSPAADVAEREVMFSEGEKMSTSLAQPLAQSQIDAASKFWAEGWESKELTQVKQAFPDRCEAVQVKAIVLNLLYRTNIIAIEKVAGLLERLLAETRTSGPPLVEELVEEIKKVTGRAHYSFVAKFVHFFLDSSVPILDSYAEEMAAWHLGPAQSKNSKRYLRFCENTRMLIELADLNCNCTDLDAYLWIAGEYKSWLNTKRKINSDLELRFQRLQKDPDSEPRLRDLLGPIKT